MSHDQSATIARDDLVRISVNHGGCKNCEACISMAEEYVGWDNDLDIPVIKQELMPRDQAEKLVSYCPTDCIEFEEVDE